MLATQLSVSLRFDPAALTTVVVLGLAIVTHLLVDEIRSLWDRLILPDLAELRTRLRSFASDLTRDDRVVLVERTLADVRRTLRAPGVCLLASPDAPRLGLPHHVGDAPGEWVQDPEALRHPVYAGERFAGELVAGARAGGVPYTEGERVWFSLVAGQVSVLLCHETLARGELDRLEATLRRLRELQEEQARIRATARALAAGGGPLRPEDVRRMLRGGASPARLCDVVFRGGTSLEFLRGLGPEQVGSLLRDALEAAVESLRPPGEAPSVDELRERPLRKKRKTRVPAGWAEYHIARLLLAGYSVEAVAERLDLSARQVYHYLDRLAVRIAPVLDRQLRQTSR